MKKFICHVLFFAGAASMLLVSCKKDYEKVYFNGGTTPVLTATATDSISLPLSDTTGNAVTFNWTNPNYQFSDGISSMNVTYYLEFDTASSFNSPILQTIAISSSLSQTFTVSSLNALLANKMLLTAGVPHTIDVQLQSFVSPYTSGSAPVSPLVSGSLSFSVTPYVIPPAVTPPSNDSLYIVGAAIAADNWANPMPTGSIPSETFTRKSATDYQITAVLVGGGEYKLISSNGSWTDQWSVAKADTYPTGGPFVFNGANMIAPPASGTYLIDVNFQTGNFTVTAQ
jgi:starch-binding outer membrane protein SusE/F